MKCSCYNYCVPPSVSPLLFSLLSPPLSPSLFSLLSPLSFRSFSRSLAFSAALSLSRHISPAFLHCFLALFPQPFSLFSPLSLFSINLSNVLLCLFFSISFYRSQFFKFGFQFFYVYFSPLIMVLNAVQVFINGVWGAVCDDRFGRSEAEMACKAVGYSE